MEWTKQPTQEGWYWRRSGPADREPTIEYVSLNKEQDGLQIWHAYRDEGQAVESVGGEWYGPLQPPA